MIDLNILAANRRNATILLDVPIDQKTIEELMADVGTALDKKRSQIVFACANPHSLVEAREDELFMAALRNADQVVADGVGITVMAKIAHIPTCPRITGTDYFLAVMRELEKRKGRVYFFGSSGKVLDCIAEKMKHAFPAITLCGMFSPPYYAWSDDENEEMIRKINDAHPDVLWVGMTAPRQEKWVEKSRQNIAVPLIGSIGAVFDFFAGTVPRSPSWMVKLGIEWIYRLMREPRRMWKRNFISAPKFVLLMIKHHFFQRGQTLEQWKTPGDKN